MNSGYPLRVFVVTGQLAAGKSTVAKALMEKYPLGTHIDVDGVREMVVSGLASPLEPGAEVERQFEIAVEGAMQLAALYLRNGFAVAVEGAIDPRMVDRAAELHGIEDDLVRIELFPKLDEALRRNRTRSTKDFDTAILDDAIRAIDQMIRDDPVAPGWCQIDSTDQSVEETVSQILQLVD